MNIDRHRVIQRFTAYVQKFDYTDAGVVLKYEHSMRVSRIIEDIARGISLSDGDVNLAWCIGVLHDIGRFEQLREYHTFIDYRSVDHAKYGAKYLFGEGHIRDFLTDASEDDVIRLAVGLHNVFQLPCERSHPGRGSSASSSGMPIRLTFSASMQRIWRNRIMSGIPICPG